MNKEEVFFSFSFSLFFFFYDLCIFFFQKQSDKFGVENYVWRVVNMIPLSKERFKKKKKKMKGRAKREVEMIKF